MKPQINRRDLLKLLALLPFLGLKPSRPLLKAGDSRADSRLPNVLILVFDAFSAKNASVYGYHRETTPNLARFAEKATVYHAHYAGGNHTSPGVASLLTGTYPWSHRALHLHGTVTGDYKDKSLFSAFAGGGYYRTAYSHNLLVTSLFHQFSRDLDVLKKTRDLCLVDDQFADRVFPGDFNVAFWSEWLLLREGEIPAGSLFASLFHRMLRYVHKRELTAEYGDLFPRGIPNLHNLLFILEHATDWLIDQLGRLPRPFLSYIHLLPPHEPYSPRRDFVDLFDDDWAPVAKEPHYFSEGHSNRFLNGQRREYDQYVAYADAEFGRLYDYMAQSGVLGNTYVVVTSDHGEMFERGIRGHVTQTLYEPVVRVPLIISKPGQQQREDVFVPTSAVDLLPTLLHATGQPVADWCEGKVLPTFGGGDAGTERSIFSVEAKSNPKQAPLTKATVALIKGQHKLIRYLGHPSYEKAYELYDLDNDPEELEDLCGAAPSIAAGLRDELQDKLTAVDRPYEDDR